MKDMTLDTRPAPRLPLDTSEYVAIKEGALDGFITFEPSEPVYQVSLLQTQTPNYWPSAFERAIYDNRLDSIFPDQPSVEAVARPVLGEWAKVSPRPPQWGWS